MNLLPRDTRFFDLLEEHTRLTVQSAHLLNEAVVEGPAKVQAAAIYVQQLEHQADTVLHDLFIALNSSFLTPLDPEDIHALASRLDDVIDGIEECSYRLSAYRLRTIPDHVIELCGIVSRASEQIQQAIRNLARNQDLSAQCIEINRLENVADAIGRQSIETLMNGGTDPIELLKLKEIYDFIERTVDRCEDTADVLRDLLVKNG